MKITNILPSICLMALMTIQVASAATVRGRVMFPPHIEREKMPHSLDNVEITLTHSQTLIRSSTFSMYDNSFQLDGLKDGTYLLEFYHPHYIFPTYKLEHDNDRTVFTNLDDGSKTQLLSGTFMSIPVAGAWKYFQQRQKMNMMGMLMNPMVILMVVSMALMFFTPKMMENIDPEELKKMQQEQGAATDPQKALNSLLGVKEEDSDSD